MHPVARRSDVIVHEVGNEIVVFDKRTAKAHALNETASFVFRSADGETSIVQLAAAMATALGTPADEELIEMSLQRLDRVGLLEERFTPSGGPEKITRRQVMRRLGVAALAIPLITTIAAPTPAMAQSGARTPVDNGTTASAPLGGVPAGQPGGSAGTTGTTGTIGSTETILASASKKHNGSCCSSNDDCLSGRCLDFGIGGLCVG